MSQVFPFPRAVVLSALIFGGAAECGAWSPEPAAWVSWDEFGYPAPAPCERVPVATYWTSDYRAPAQAAPVRCPSYVLHPPLRPAAGIDPFDRPAELNGFW